MCCRHIWNRCKNTTKKNTIGKFANRYYSLLYFFNKISSLPMMRSKMVFLFVLLLASLISYILPHTFVDRVCGSSFHTQYNFRDLLKLLCKGICYALSLCKVKALLGFQNLHAYGSYFGAKPCIDVHNTFLRHIISNKSRK